MGGAVLDRVLLKIARDAIKSRFDAQKLDVQDIVQKYPELKNKGASFVTLTKDGALRGCIGSIIAHRTLLDDIVSNAQAAAFEDPRFEPLREEELDAIKIEVSLLTPPTPLAYSSVEDLKDKVRANIDGVILMQNGYQATFLPQVWEELPSFELFFAHLCQKAGLSTECLNSHPDIYLYQVEKIKES